MECVGNIEIEECEEYDEDEEHEEEELRTCFIAAMVHTWIKYIIWLTMLEWPQR